MRVTYVITRSDTIGGVHVHVRDLCLALADRGDEVCVLTGGSGPFTEELRARGVPFRSLRHLCRPISLGDDARALGELRAALARLRPDLVSTHSSKAGWLGRLAGRALGVPVLFTAHGWAFTDGVGERRGAVYRLLERAAAPLAARIVTVSDYDRRLAIRARIASADRLVTIHNGMPDVAAELRAAPERPDGRILMVARFEEQKDHPTLLRALAGLADRPWRLDLVGDGPCMARCVALATELGVADRVRFVGFTRQVAQHVRDARIFVLATNWEGFPRTILEAMRAGLPVVASDVGGVGEAVRDGETGRLVPRGDAAALRAALARLLDDPDGRARMGAAGRRRYEDEFTLERMFARTTALYEETRLRRAAPARAAAAAGAG